MACSSCCYGCNNCPCSWDGECDECGVSICSGDTLCDPCATRQEMAARPAPAASEIVAALNAHPELRDKVLTLLGGA